MSAFEVYCWTARLYRTGTTRGSGKLYFQILMRLGLCVSLFHRMCSLESSCEVPNGYLGIKSMLTRYSSSLEMYVKERQWYLQLGG